MDWWQTLVVTVVPVLLTLVITNVAESRRRKQDAAQRERERAADREAREDERRAAIEDHWRNERLSRMTALVDLVSDLTRLAVDAKNAYGWAEGEDNEDLVEAFVDEGRKAVIAIAARKESELPQVVTRVAVIASQRFYVHSLGLLDEVRTSFKPLFQVAILRLKEESQRLAAKQASADLAQRMTVLNTRLINAVREELTGDAESFMASPQLKSAVSRGARRVGG